MGIWFRKNWADLAMSACTSLRRPAEGRTRAIARVSGLAAAPMPVAQQGFSIEEVIVIARKRDESAQDVPISIDGLDESTLEDFAVIVLAVTNKIYLIKTKGYKSKIAKSDRLPAGAAGCDGRHQVPRQRSSGSCSLAFSTRARTKKKSLSRLR